MQEGDTRKLITVLYVLTLLFLGAIYFQGEVVAEPNAISTLQNVPHTAAGSHSIQLITNFQMSGESALLAVISVTLFFGFAWLATQPKSY